MSDQRLMYFILEIIAKNFIIVSPVYALYLMVMQCDLMVLMPTTL